MSPCAASFIEYIRSVRRYSPRTVSIYSDVISDYESVIGEIPSSLDVKGLREYEVALLDSRRLKASTVSLHLSVLGSLCNYLVKKGIIPSNPGRLVKRPSRSRRLPEFFREEALVKYFSSHRGTLEFGTYDAALRYMIVSILYSTGIRRSELVSLKRGSVDFGRRVLKVRGKGDKMREIPLVPLLCEEISLYLSRVAEVGGDDDPQSPLLLTPRGRMLNPVSVDKAVKKELSENEGFTGRKSPHVFRHTLATELLEYGSDLNSIKELLGHSSLAATQVYTHAGIERLREVYDKAHPRSGSGAAEGGEKKD